MEGLQKGAGATAAMNWRTTYESAAEGSTFGNLNVTGPKAPGERRWTKHNYETSKRSTPGYKRGK